MYTSESEWPVPQRPMELRTIYASAGRLSVRTVGRGVLVALVLLVPIYLLFGSASSAFFAATASVLEANPGITENSSPEELSAVFGPVASHLARLFLSSVLIIAGSSLVQLAITVDAWDKAVGVERSTGEWLKRTFGRPFATMLGQIIILIIVALTGGVALMLAVALFDALGGEVGAQLVSIAAMMFIVYLLVATVFRVHEIVADDRGPWRSLLSSMSLVRGRWWRVFLGLFPLAVLLVLLVELVSALIPGARFDPALADATGENLSELAPAYRLLSQVFSPTYSLATGAISALWQFLFINLVTAQYVDLRARRGDFDFEEE